MTFQDLFKKSFLEGFAANAIGTRAIVAALVFSVVLGMFIYFFYRFITRNVYYSKSFNMSLVALCIITTSIILTIQSSIVISLGMVGALSIVRFRTAVKNPLDLLYLFWSVSTGIICGVNLKVLALLISVMMTAIVLLLQMVPAMQAPLVLVLRGDAKEVDWDGVKKCVAKEARMAKQKTESFRSGQMEVIYEVRLKTKSELMDELQKISNLQGINLLAHDGEFRI